MFSGRIFIQISHCGMLVYRTRYTCSPTYGRVQWLNITPNQRSLVTIPGYIFVNPPTSNQSQAGTARKGELVSNATKFPRRSSSVSVLGSVIAENAGTSPVSLAFMSFCDPVKKPVRRRVSLSYRSSVVSVDDLTCIETPFYSVF